MRAARTAGEVSAEDLVAAVRVHADRVHDAVRRQGVAPEAAAGLVRESALDLVQRQAGSRDPADSGVGWWFARARELGGQVEHSGGALPVGSGPLADDDLQGLLAAALSRRPERERTALLLRDAYDLPAEVVGAALDTDADSAMRLVGRARMAMLPEVYDTVVPSLSGHSVDEAALARLAERREVRARDATTRRHAQSCRLCQPALDAQDDARHVLSGLSVIALPEAAREQLLAAVQEQAALALPSAAELAAREPEHHEEDDLPRRLFSPLLVIFVLLLAVAAGVGAGVATSGSEPEGVAVDPLPPVTAPPVLTLPPVPPPTADPEPTTSVFTLSPPPTTPPPTTAPPTTAPPTTTSPTSGAVITLDPTSGEDGTTVTVAGRGWPPDTTVDISYLDALGEPTGTTDTGDVQEDGTFFEDVVLDDPDGLAGPHTVSVTDGTSTATATFTQQ